MKSFLNSVKSSLLGFQSKFSLTLGHWQSKLGKSPSTPELTANKALVFLSLILLVSFTIRFYKLGSIPTGALIDEAHFGYLAHSLWQTGRDEHGVAWPLIFSGFGDQKLPANAYLLIPWVATLGLSNFAIRIPAALAGSLMPLAMYWLARESKLSRMTSVWAAAITAVSPWFIFLSRFGFESNLALFFMVMGLAGLLKWEESKVWSWRWALWSSFWLGATWYAYISFRPIVLALPLVTTVLAWWFSNSRPAIFSLFPKLIGWYLLLLVAVLPLLMPKWIAANSTRLNQVGLFADQAVALSINENRTFCTMQAPKWWCYGIWNKPTVVSQILVSRYFQSFGPQFLATQGEGENIFLTIKGFGQYYWWLYPFWILGFVSLWISNANLKISNFAKSLLMSGLLLAPIPTILVGIPQPVRLAPLAPFITILIAIGVVSVITWFKSKSERQLLVGALVLGLTFYTAWFMTDFYFVHSQKNDYYYQSYLPDLMKYLNSLPPETQIYLKPYYSDPIMFFAYYNKFDPATYQQQAVLGDKEASGFQHTVGLGRVRVTDESLETLGCLAWKSQKSIVLATNENLSGEVIYQGRSASGVHNYVYVYDAKLSVPPSQCQ